jgi:hypothetical protein
MILKKGKRIEKDIFINTGRIKRGWFFSIWNLELVIWNLFEI